MIHHFLKIIKNELKIKKMWTINIPPLSGNVSSIKRQLLPFQRLPLHWTGVFSSRLVAKTKTAV